MATRQPIFSKTCLVVVRCNKLQSFCPPTPENISWLRPCKTFNHWCRRRGCSRWKYIPTSFDLVKIRAKSVEIWAKSLKILSNSRKYEQKWRPTAPKITWRAFFWMSLFMESHFGQVWENSGKNPLHPQKFGCSYTYEFNRKQVASCRNKNKNHVVWPCGNKLLPLSFTMIFARLHTTLTKIEVVTVSQRCITV